MSTDVTDPRVRPDTSVPASWETIEAYATDQAVEAAAGRGPRRTQAIDARYKRYTEWCATRGHTGVDLILATAIWQSVDAGSERPPVRLALEVNIVPYHVADGITHWVLWYHPDSLPGTTDLEPELYLPHLRAFLPSLRAADEVVAFQNLPQFRSVPQMAHAHVFLRPRTDETAAALATLRRERLMRSPWAEHERAAGRGHEVGFAAAKEQELKRPPPPSFTCDVCGKAFKKGVELGLHRSDCRPES